MEPRKLLLFAVLIGGCAVPIAVLSVAKGQAPPKASDTPYHQSDMSKPQGSISQTSSEKQPAVSTSHKPSLLGLAKISILPSSVSITGPHYGQRVVVEG